MGQRAILATTSQQEHLFDKVQAQCRWGRQSQQSTLLQSSPQKQQHPSRTRVVVQLERLTG